MQHLFADPLLIKLMIAMGLGMVLGLERFIAHKTAGMRTYTLVAMGSMTGNTATPYYPTIA